MDETITETLPCYIATVSGVTGVSNLDPGSQTATVTHSYGTGFVPYPGCFRAGVTHEVDGFPLPSNAVTSSYYDIETTTVAAGVGEGTGLTTAVMKTESSFVGWDFVNETVNGTDDLWAIDPDVNDGYPYLVANPPR